MLGRTVKNLQFLQRFSALQSQRCLNTSIALLTSTSASPNNFEVNANLVNRNPRNLEQMMIARKPLGFEWDKPSRTFWYKLVVEISVKNIRGYVVHNDGTVVTEASSGEWGIKKQLVSTRDRSCAMNVARILAQRCLESGILAVHCEPERRTQNINAFLAAFQEAGVCLEEAKVSTEEEIHPASTLYR